MENTISKDFEEFLAKRRIDLCDRGKLDEKIPGQAKR